jgi:hypothetical protein
LPRPVQFHRVEPHLDAITIGAGRNLAIGRKQRKRCLDPAFLRGPAYGLMPEDKRSPVASRRGITIAAAAV